MKTTQDYLNLITSEHRNQPNFAAVVSLGVAVQVRVQFLLDSMIPLFDLDTPPVGDQLNIIGLWVGVPRSTVPTSVTDANYLKLVRAKIAINQWDGTTEGIYSIWATLFPGIKILIQDNQDMSMSYLVSSDFGNFTLIELMVNLGFFIKPEAVQLSAVIYAPVVDKFFGMTDARYYQRTGQIQPNASPFNTAQAYHTDWPWLDARDAIGPGFVELLATEDGTVLDTEDGIPIGLE